VIWVVTRTLLHQFVRDFSIVSHRLTARVAAAAKGVAKGVEKGLSLISAKRCTLGHVCV